MFFTLLYIHFTDEMELLRVGNKIEEILHINTNISVVKMQSFIEVITSGVLGSALVALFFMFKIIIVNEKRYYVKP